MYKILLPLASLAAGATIGSILTVNASLDIAKYLSIAILAALDSVLGGARALLEDTYDSLIMLSGFFVNALLAMALAFLGDQIGIDMFMAATICFALRIFSNLAFIRRDVIVNWRTKNAARQAAKNRQKNMVNPPIRLISAPKAAKPEHPESPQSNLENTIYDLVIDSAALEPEEPKDAPQPEPDIDQTPVKVKAIISQSKAAAEDADKSDKTDKADKSEKPENKAEDKAEEKHA